MNYELLIMTTDTSVNILSK